MTETRTLTVIGATGFLSGSMMRRFDELGVELTAVARNVDKATSLLPSTVRVVEGDVSDPGSLETALVGTRNLYVHLNTTAVDDRDFHEEREGIANVVAAAQAAGVGHIMQIAGIDALHRDFNTEGLELATNVIREVGMASVRECGIPYTFFHCSFFLDSMQLLVQDGVLAVMGDLDRYPIWFTNSSDYADVVVGAIANETAHGKAYAVQGREGVTFLQAAQRFASGLGGGIVAQPMPKSVIDQMGLPTEEAAFMGHVIAVTEQLAERFVAEDTWAELAEPRLSIEEFAATLAPLGT